MKTNVFEQNIKLVLTTTIYNYYGFSSSKFVFLIVINVNIARPHLSLREF